MTSDRRVVLRDPTSTDLYRGGRNLLNLLDGMSEQNLRRCKLEVVGGRAKMVMIGAVLFLRNLNLAQAALDRYLACHPDAAQPSISSQQEGRTK